MGLAMRTGTRIDDLELAREFWREANGMASRVGMTGRRKGRETVRLGNEVKEVKG
jgi:hypothetical protein